MEATEILEGIDQRISDFNTTLDAKLADLKIPVEASVDGEPVEAELEIAGVKSMFGQIDKIEIMGVPIGRAAVGGFAAVLVSEVVDGIMQAQTTTTQGIVKLGLAAIVQWTKRWFGAPMANTATLLLAYDGVRQLLPIDEWAGRVASAITGAFPTGGLGRGAGRVPNVLQQAEQVAKNYYPGIAQRVG